MSKMNQKPIDEATVQELREFAVNSVGIEVAQSATRAQVLAKLQPAWQHPYIMVADEPTEAVVIAKPAPNQDSSKDERVFVIIDMQDVPGGSEPVFLSVNGRGIFVPRGKPCEIAARYLECLKHAKQTTYTQDPDDKAGNLIPRTVYQYPWRQISPVEAKSFKAEAA